MKPRDGLAIHLTYCLNIHPGETWQENFASIKQKALKVRQKVSPNKPFGLGLRLSNIAAQELVKPERRKEFQDFLNENDLYVFTINGFPYGKFHSTTVKENVYKPDWSTTERRDYTITLANILTELLDENLYGSISTVPLSYKGWVTSEKQLDQIIYMLADAAVHLDKIFNQTGKDICIGLEPEPDCILENTDQTIDFFSGSLLEAGSRHLQQNHGLDYDKAKQILTRHIGVCFDTAHLAVQFEDLNESLTKLNNANIRISKVQLSSALRLRPCEEAFRRLKDFCDTVYLHQVKIKTASGAILSYSDLGEALEIFDKKNSAGTQWRIHFHVPLFFVKDGPLQSTSNCLTPEFFSQLTNRAVQHLEIETYTFNVLPQFMQEKGLFHALGEEYKWVLARLK